MNDEMKWYHPLIPAIFLSGLIGGSGGGLGQLAVNILISYAICYGILNYIVNRGNKKEEDSE